MNTSSNINNIESNNRVNNRVSITTKTAALFVQAHTFAEVVKSGLFDMVLYTSTLRSIPRKGSSKAKACKDITTPTDIACVNTKAHKDGSITAIYEDEDWHALYVTFCPFNDGTPEWYYGELSQENRAEVLRANTIAETLRAATLQDEKEIRTAADRLQNIKTGDRVWCKHYRTMGTVTGTTNEYGSAYYQVRYDKPVMNRDTNREETGTDVLGYLRIGITKNYDEQGERQGTAQYYAEQLRFSCCGGFNYVFGPVHIRTKACAYNHDNGTGWGVLYAVTISDGVSDGTTYSLDIFQTANLLAMLYAKKHDTDPVLYEASEIKGYPRPSSWMTDYTADDFQKLTANKEAMKADPDIMGKRMRLTGKDGNPIGLGELQVFIQDYAGNAKHALYYIWDEWMQEVRANVRSLEWLRSHFCPAKGWHAVAV